MKILHINSYYSISHFYKNLFDTQVKNGLDITVFVPVSKSFSAGDFNHGEYTTLEGCFNKYDRFFFRHKQSKVLKAIIKSFNLNDYSLIHAHSLFTNGTIAYALNKMFKTKYIVAVRNTDINIFFKRMFFLRKLGLKTLINAERIIFLSEPYKNQLLTKYIPKSIYSEIEKKIMIIPNGVDDFWHANKNAPRDKNYDNVVEILHVGDINKNKNIELTLEAIQILKSKGITAKLRIVGKIKNNRIYNRFKHLEYVNYLGFLGKEGLLTVYRECDLFVLPSITETFGLVYVEALSQGLPIIYTRDQGFDGQLPEGSVGYSVNSQDAKELAMNIVKILDNYKELSANGIKSTNMFNWERIHILYEDIYSEVIK